MLHRKLNKIQHAVDRFCHYYPFMPKTHLDALRVTQKEYDSMDKARLKLGAVPVRIAAQVYGRDPAWVRAGIIAGWLPIGEATRNGRRVTDLKEMSSTYGRINYYISPKLLFEQTGYEWRGEK